MERTTQYATGLTLLLEKGPFQNNGASPWYATLGLGSHGQKLKFSFDTGSNFVWVTSSLCAADSCQHYGNQRFNYQLSNTFSWVDQALQQVDFGPWGTMEVASGQDNFHLTSTGSGKLEKVSVTSDIYLAQSYSGQQFEELDWDGGIGLPSLVNIPDAPQSGHVYRGAIHGQEGQPSFHFFQTLVEQGVVSPDQPYVTFLTEQKVGKCEMGRLNYEYADSLEYLYLPWEAFSIASVSYIWTSPLTSFAIGDKVLISEEDSSKQTYSFCLDSGSSQFKGDPKVMNEAFALATKNKQDVVIELSQTDQGEKGKLVVPASVYDVLIEAGDSEGQRVPQFAELTGLDTLVLVGSVVMDYLYTVYEYDITPTTVGYEIQPKGMWMFNKKSSLGENLPKIITTKQSQSARIFQSA